MSREHRGTIFVEEAQVLSHDLRAGEQYTLRVNAPECAARARPGQFVHLRCDTDIPMRRPLSIMRVEPAAGWLEVLYKPIGHGLDALSKLRTGDPVNLLGPIGQGFSLNPDRPVCVLIGGGVGIPPLLFLAEQLAKASAEYSGIAFFGSELPFPFVTQASQLALDAPPAATHSLQLLDDWGVPGRLASGAGLDGCYTGYVTELARHWLNQLNETERQGCTLFSCGPNPMLRASQALADDFGLPSQLCLEEYMACAVGGCAGCAVEVHTEQGPAMRRVCVDGPVFDGATVYPARPAD
ncbi:MAG: dihydroorotate dehydrogenase electron transfer subunit [Gammaproteobacteria bacterium]